MAGVVGVCACQLRGYKRKGDPPLSASDVQPSAAYGWMEENGEHAAFAARGVSRHIFTARYRTLNEYVSNVGGCAPSHPRAWARGWWVEHIPAAANAIVR